MSYQVLLSILYLPLFPLLDRWGGGGFEFCWPSAPAVLRTGIKAIRRFGIPAFLFFLDPSLLSLLGAILVCLFFCQPLLESSDGALAFYKDAALSTLVLAGGLIPFSGAFAVVAPIVWMSGLYLSNAGIAGRKLAWHYVELLRGLAIAIGALAYYAL